MSLSESAPSVFDISAMIMPSEYPSAQWKSSGSYSHAHAVLETAFYLASNLGLFQQHIYD